MRLAPESPLTCLQRALADGLAPARVAATVLEKANQSLGRNTYLSLDRDGLQARADLLQGVPRSLPLYGVPISVKDCFDLAGTRTSFGTRFYAERNEIATNDSAVVKRLLGCGALVTGKTHLHPLAYGITGQNPDYGDCLQPRDPALLTGGSSSGAAASVQEGSALAAIGTDTGGSIRVPAALCGLTGYRASHCLAAPDGLWPEMWQGAWALAPSFDTLGLICSDPRDAATLAEAIFRMPAAEAKHAPRVGCVPDAFLHDASREVLEAYAAWKQELATRGAMLAELDPGGWAEGIEIFTGIQAYEASQVHSGHLDEFGETIGQRLHRGASMTPEELAGQRERHRQFRDRLCGLFASLDVLMLPCANVARLEARADHTTTRATILRYTVPFSLGGLPVLSLPGELVGAPRGTGMQVAAAPGQDAALLAFGKMIGNGLARG